MPTQPTSPAAARFPLPVRRATWGSPGRLMCEWPDCRAVPHLDKDAKINVAAAVAWSGLL